VLKVNHVDQKIEFAYEISDDVEDHVWEIEMINKQPQHTVIDQEGKIVQDVLLQVADMCIDGIGLGNLVSEVAEYVHDGNGSGQTCQDKFYGNMGCNGVVRLKFISPVYIWLLENL
jgi:hypothetical protein